MGPTNPGTKCCKPATLYKGDFLCGACTQDGVKCANSTACAATCCSGSSVQDAAGQHYCGCVASVSRPGQAAPAGTAAAPAQPWLISCLDFAPAAHAGVLLMMSTWALPNPAPSAATPRLCMAAVTCVARECCKAPQGEAARLRVARQLRNLTSTATAARVHHPCRCSLNGAACASSSACTADCCGRTAVQDQANFQRYCV